MKGTTLAIAVLVAATALSSMASAAVAAAPHKTVKVKAGHKTTKAAPKSVSSAAWRFPACTDTPAEYEYVYSGDPCTIPPAAIVQPIVPAPSIESGFETRNPPSRRNPVFCNGNAEYDYVYSGCEG